MYKVIISKSVLKFLKTQTKVFKVKVLDTLDEIAESPFEKKFDIKKMKGIEDHYRVRIGKVRFLFHLNGEELVIYFYKAGFRGDIYKK